MKLFWSAALWLLGAAACSNQRPAEDPEASSYDGSMLPASAVVDRPAAEPADTTARDTTPEKRQSSEIAPPAPPGTETGPVAGDPETDIADSELNLRDEPPSLTPMDQGDSELDRTMTQQIRKTVTADDSLSLLAKNVQIITNRGKVTLLGQVVRERERAAIAAAAARVAGAANVNNEIEVKKQK